ncbi:phosphoadenosine phosphosulfate reductase [Methanocalculus sp. AMF5]|uniref:phosphoadenosine phosphosulfate reductase domain-containing protein n=1 Tax=Methanocalculus sp. AMF5 TaxID=1198257 RepID=UPI00209ED444|nr:phosphoadenosine phosphosulfate reductase family protein [Methanocalculus sp. AMF5]MCP1662129.1 phosphoadenosine phosphosulfate reductase [Methanocalculus sp. AMF5]
MKIYSYTYDKKTGGILLNSSPNGHSKEPRPVYAPELDVLGFDKYWKYKRQTDSPYMWAEANNYYYRGKLVAKLKGGNVYTAPEIIIPNEETGDQITPEPEGMSLRPVDIEGMVEANREMLEIIEQTTVKKILATYEKYKGKLDLFHVAFSGGKDSCVLLDLVKKALPKGSFVVVFGDTGMEFPDTYEVIKKIKQQCLDEEIAFYIAKSHLDPKDSWELFGPPSRTLRWCCSVHKSTPQTLKLRELTGKNSFIGLDFVGVRAQESFARSTYMYENYGTKQKGQFSHNSILEWTSAEIWLYIYANDLFINDAYKKGNTRAGCLFCPMSGGASDFLRRINYTDEIDFFISIIKNSNGWDTNKKDIETYVINGGWNNRRSGRGIVGNVSKYFEKTTNGLIIIEIIHPSSNWQEWIKTIDDTVISFSVEMKPDGLTVTVSESQMKQNPLAGKLLRQVFKKTAYCVGCKVCEANCSNGCLSFTNGKIRIENCIHCGECHQIYNGCLMYESLKIPKEEKRMKAINCFDDHAPMTNWLGSFFNGGDNFFASNNLGPNQLKCFKRFLRDAGLQDKNKTTSFTELIINLGWESSISQGLILVNLVYDNPQIEWYVNELSIGQIYTRKVVEDMLTAMDVKKKAAQSVVKAFKRLTETPLGNVLHFGFVTDEGNLVRTKCSVSDPRVVLYGLFRFAEKCNDYKEFTLATLLNDNIDRNGTSPARIFGLDRDDMTPILIGLSAKYPDFITASFTHDLEKITLAEDKSSQDVLDLFKEDAASG